MDNPDNPSPIQKSLSDSFIFSKSKSPAERLRKQEFIKNQDFYFHLEYVNEQRKNPHDFRRKFSLPPVYNVNNQLSHQSPSTQLLHKTKSNIY